MIERKIALEELTSKVLTNTIFANKAVEDNDKERLFKDLDSRILMRGLIAFLGRPIVHSMYRSNVFDKEELYSERAPQTKYWFAWMPKSTIELNYDPLDSAMPQRYSGVKNKPDTLPSFERVSVRKRRYDVRETNAGFDYFFSTDQNKGFLTDINSSIDLNRDKHNTFFREYHGILNKVKKGYVFERSTFEQGIRIVREEFLKEIQKLLDSEQAYRPILR